METLVSSGGGDGGDGGDGGGGKGGGADGGEGSDAVVGEEVVGDAVVGDAVAGVVSSGERQGPELPLSDGGLRLLHWHAQPQLVSAYPPAQPFPQAQFIGLPPVLS